MENKEKQDQAPTPTKRFTLVKKRDLPRTQKDKVEKTPVQSASSETNIQAKLAQENFKNKNSLSFFKLALEIGFEENDEMIDIRNSMIKSGKRELNFLDLYSQYEDLAMSVIDKSSNRINGQIALIIVQSIIYLEINDGVSFMENINIAKNYSRHYSEDIFKEIQEIIKAMPYNI